MTAQHWHFVADFSCSVV